MKSLLFVPSKPKMLEKIKSFEADSIIIDLEDSISEDCKRQALEDACHFLSADNEKDIYIRLDGNHLEEELFKLNDYSLSGYMLPKFENPDIYLKYNHYFSNKRIIALVETPLGIVNIKEIACSSLVDIIAFGAEDFTSSIGMKNSVETLNYVRSVIVTYGKAFKKNVIDTPSFVINDDELLAKEVQVAVDLGFDGKLAIHPNQISIINKLFQMYDLDEMKAVVAKYESSGEAVLRIDDKVYEKMHIAHFKRILKEHGII